MAESLHSGTSSRSHLAWTIIWMAGCAEGVDPSQNPRTPTPESGVFYVSPDGTTDLVSGGTAANPWDLQTALNHPSRLNPGNALYLKGGTYFGRFVSQLNGVAGSLITVGSAPREWAILDGNTATTLLEALPAQGDALGYSPCKFTSMKGIVIGNDVVVDDEVLNINQFRGGVPYCTRAWAASVAHAHAAGATVYLGGAVLNVQGSYVEFKNLEVQNSDPERVKPYNNEPLPGVNFHNSFRDTGINIFAPNSRFTNLVIHDNGIGVGLWRPAVNTEFYGNIVYHNGYVTPNRPHGHGIYSQNSDGYKLIEDNIVFGNFYFGIQLYGTDDAYLRGFKINENAIFEDISVGWGGVDGTVNDLEYRSNYHYDSNGQLPFMVGANVVASGNYYYGDYLTIGGSTYSVDGMSKSGTEVVCRPNSHEAGRAHVIVFNTLPATRTALVDLGCAGVTRGSAFSIHDVQNLHSAAVYSGTYDGQSVTLPLDLVAKEPVIGFTTGVTALPLGMADAFYLPKPTHTKSEFNVFLVRSVPPSPPMPTPDAGVPDAGMPDGSVSPSNYAVGLSAMAWIDVPDMQPSSGGWDPASDWTMEAYIKTQSDGFIVGNAESSDLRVANQKLLLQYTTSSPNALYGTRVVADGSWHHVAVVKQGSSVRSYVDGAADGPTQSLSGSSNPLLGYLALGQRGSNVGFFQGALCEVRIYKKAKTIVGSGSNPCQPTSDTAELVAAWHLTEGQGTQIPDYSGHGQTAVLQAGATWVTQ